MPRFEEAVEKWPHMKVNAQKGVIQITGRYTAPSEWWEKIFPILTGVVWIGLLFIYWPAAIGVMVITVWGVFVGPRQNLDIKITPDAVKFGRKNYRRGMSEYSVEEHEKGYDEHQQEARKNKRIQRIYREAIQVVMRYGEKRIAVADFKLKDKEKAGALVRRLQLLDQGQGFEQIMRDAQPKESGAKPHVDDDEFGAPPDVR